jgi:hypothetical protein
MSEEVFRYPLGRRLSYLLGAHTAWIVWEACAVYLFLQAPGATMSIIISLLVFGVITYCWDRYAYWIWPVEITVNGGNIYLRRFYTYKVIPTQSVMQTDTNMRPPFWFELGITPLRVLYDDNGFTRTFYITPWMDDFDRLAKILSDFASRYYTHDLPEEKAAEKLSVPEETETYQMPRWIRTLHSVMMILVTSAIVITGAAVRDGFTISIAAVTLVVVVLSIPSIKRTPIMLKFDGGCLEAAFMFGRTEQYCISDLADIAPFCSTGPGIKVRLKDGRQLFVLSSFEDYIKLAQRLREIVEANREVYRHD